MRTASPHCTSSVPVSPEMQLVSAPPPRGAPHAHSTPSTSPCFAIEKRAGAQAHGRCIPEVRYPLCESCEDSSFLSPAISVLCSALTVSPSALRRLSFSRLAAWSVKRRRQILLCASSEFLLGRSDDPHCAICGAFLIAASSMIQAGR